jgi:tetratricopeptide (TPR) repeat protein
VLRVGDADLPTADIGDPAELHVGHLVLAVGYGPRVSWGVLSALGGPWRTSRGGGVDQLMRLDLTLYPGFSGGPLVDAQGRVVGVNSSGLSRQLELAIPATTVSRIAAELLDKGRVTRGFLGVGLHPVPLPEAWRGALTAPAEIGLMVASLQPDGPSATAGLMLGDVLVALDGAPVQASDDVQRMVSAQPVGTVLVATVLRAGLADGNGSEAWPRRQEASLLARCVDGRVAAPESNLPVDRSVRAMSTDRQGNSLSGGTPAAIEQFDAALGEFNLYRSDPVATAERALALAPGFVMAHVLKAYLLGLATEPEATRQAAQVLASLRDLPMDDRERSHAQALEHLLAGNWTAAALALDFHSARYPRDLLALQAGHLMDFYRASARALRDRIGRTLPHWSATTPGYGIVIGMYAFGLEEAGDYARAEDAGRQAIDVEPRDCWAHHAVAHVMEMQGRAQDGIGWMVAREPHWAAEDNFFRIHNWWHLALCHLDLGQRDEVLRLYDGPIRGGRSGIALDLVDASSLLWRLHLTGQDVGDRWDEVAQAWERHADGRLYPFNDWHAVMAYLGAGREREIAQVVSALRGSAGQDTDTGRWARLVALPLIEGVRAFWRGEYRQCAETLHGARFITNQFGGSHAQRDVIDWTMTEAAVRGGLEPLAAALAHERLALRPHSPLNRLFLARARPSAS